jgi:hypothetical protein
MYQPFQVVAAPESPLGAMLARLDAAEAEAAEAAANVKALKDGIKATLTALTAPDGHPHLAYHAAADGAAPRTLRWQMSSRLDTTRLKAERPDVCAAYVKESGAWVLAVAK